MGVLYQAIGWNRQKKIYDRIMVGLMAVFLIVFIILNAVIHPQITPETLIIRATGSLAIVMLHVILMIGPLARLDTRFLPLLYNRRHLGVSMFLMAAVHGIFSLIQFHSLGSANPLVSIFTSNPRYATIANFPFQSLGFIALIILFLMAATSHDFWLHNLSPRIWKTLHMFVYLAYGLVIMHVMLGVVQLESSPTTITGLGLGLIAIILLHLVAGNQQQTKEKALAQMEKDGYYVVGDISDIEPDRAKIVMIGQENIAIFRYDNKLSAVSNICKHQNGPIGEGKVINGCIVCPWHGFEYRPHDGCSPAPFTEKVSTYNLRLNGTTIWVHPSPHPEGTHVDPITLNL